MSYQLDFIQKILSGAKKAYQQYNVLPSLTMAQAALESNWGKNGIGNNLFGIKATSSWTGKKQYVWTTEYDANGNAYKCQDWFRDYDSIDDSILDHGKLLTWSNYDRVRASLDYKEACKAVQTCGYATDPEYANLLIDIIEAYNLNQYDVKEEVLTMEDLRKQLGITDKSWAKGQIDTLKTNGLISDAHDPNEILTMGVLAVIMNNFYAKVMEKIDKKVDKQ